MDGSLACIEKYVKFSRSFDGEKKNLVTLGIAVLKILLWILIAYEDIRCFYPG